MKHSLPLLLTLLFSLSPLPAIGGSYDTEFAKLNTSDAGVVDVGAMEISLGWGFLSTRKAFDSEGTPVGTGLLKEHELSLGWTAGLMKDFDLTAGLGYAHSEIEDSMPSIGKGIGDLELIGRWRPVQGSDWALALLPQGVFPTGTGASEGNAGATQDYTTWGLSALYQKDLGHFPLNLEAGYTIGIGDGAEGYDDTLALNAALGWHLAPSILPIVEANYYREFYEEGVGHALALTAGLLFPTENSGRFQLGVSPVLLGENSGGGTTLGLSWVYGFSIEEGE
jgi:hypothetical protein